ncbi:KATNB1-like protein 1 [Betta splendens]|uniref:KATNB1-like protein 1 n=1 Tax=Betta splendens TaxID=158456 RepID=A0A6P7LK13_BETSP|nr:KATNB1-like protein 1 [Betta splendens]
MDSSNEDDNQNRGSAPQHDAAQYRVDYDYDECNKQRHPGSRSGNVPSRVKRVVSCKRRTHHLTVARKKQPGPGRTTDGPNKENEMQDVKQEIFNMDPWEFPININTNHQTGKAGSEEPDNRALSELAGDHSTVADVLFGRSLRLRVALTLWQRSVGELLTYFLRIQDTAVFVDFLPIITKSIDENCARVTIGCCVDLLPLVKQVLRSPYEDYLTVGLKWMHSVLNNWHDALRAGDCDESAETALDINVEAFKQQVVELWYQNPSLASLPGPAGDAAKVIDSLLSHLTCRQ